jgi:hypothetical protein
VYEIVNPLFLGLGPLSVGFGWGAGGIQGILGSGPKGRRGQVVGPYHFQRKKIFA